MVSRSDLLGRLVAALRRIAADRRAVSAVEFALLLPLMLTLFIGGNEVSQAMTIYRKISRTGSTLGDLAASIGRPVAGAGPTAALLRLAGVSRCRPARRP